MNTKKTNQKKWPKWFRAFPALARPDAGVEELSRHLVTDTYDMIMKLIRVTAVTVLLGLMSAAQLTYANNPSAYSSISVAPDQMAVIAFQIRLQQAGYYNGPVTGVLDLATSVAIARFQRTHGLLGTGEIDQPTAQALGIHLYSPYMRPAI